MSKQLEVAGIDLLLQLPDPLSAEMFGFKDNLPRVKVPITI